jgi:hypothetical protein
MSRELLTQPASDFKARRILKDVGCKQHVVTQLSHRFLPPIIAIAASAAIVILFWFARELSSAALRVDVGNVIVAAALLLGIYQWRMSLEKDALEKFQAEIREANEAKSKWLGVREMMVQHYLPGDQTSEREYEKSLYVYQQLDNLEFALERYLQGFTSAYTAFRSVITFQDKCCAPEFHARAAQLFRKGSYSPPVRNVICYVLERTVSLTPRSS